MYTATNEAMVLTGAFDDTHPLPYVFSAQGTNRAGQITNDRLQDKIFFRESVFTDVASCPSTAKAYRMGVPGSG